MVMLRLKILLLRSINLPKWLQLKMSHLSLTMTMLFMSLWELETSNFTNARLKSS